jgi:hypothetical protein
MTRGDGTDKRQHPTSVASMHQTIDEDGKMGITHPKADVSGIV